ncbi:RluA family pseudouridine synthase [Wolbachia endosymbiont of Howardula sp.]|uniref:RluA family pseudouridine synthase n=1 Tax=Wolbachia endosymbiont of Howardula sp. TaxID=2916816 RepID=UPI00217D0C88|nr:RluA family pseudouridine synthase [Wolbachia endosymbiont of Howardula sp.]UWI83069.1 RluA family pseudouridine synthase [Wolbachia endosymbiont of Howardula sp.]
MSPKITTILIEEDGVRLDRYMRTLFPHLKQSSIERSLREGLIKIDDHKIKSNYRIHSRQILTIKNLVYIEQINSNIKYNTQLLELIRSNILYEDDYILAINKPIGLIVQGGIKVKMNISDLLHQIRETKTFKIVHRLDKDTSGVIIFASNTQVARHLMEEFKARRIHKTYLALTVGIPSRNQGLIDLPITKRNIYGKEKMVVDPQSNQNAITRFCILKRLQYNIAHLQLNPITGRTHQLRAHLAYINCPILGDGKYGGKKAFVQGMINKMHLHASSISVTLPNNKTINITAPLPIHMRQSLELLNA